MADKRKLPIDIQYKQLLGACAAWLEQQKQIRDAIAVLYPQLPLASDSLTKLRTKKPSHEDLHYFDCKYVFACLAESDEGASKNFFGQVRDVAAPVPVAVDLEKEVNKANMCSFCWVLVYVAGAEADLTKSIADYKRKLESSCADMGIPGNNFREELGRLPLELPSIFAGVAKAICCDDIADAIEYHRALQTYLHDCEAPTAAPAAGPESLSSSKKDRKAKRKDKKQAAGGDEIETSTDEPFEIIMAPHEFFAAIEELRNARDQAVDAVPSLDFETEAAEISWDISLDGGGAADSGEIDWGIETVPIADSPAADLDVPVEIDWDITSSDVVEPVNESDASGATDVQETEAEHPSGDATSERASRVELLGDNEFRSRVLNDLLELGAFLRQRREELSASDSVAFANQFQGSSRNTEKIEDFQAAVDHAVSHLSAKRLQQLVLIKSSERYLDRHVASLEMLTKHMDKCRREIGALEDKNVDLIDASTTVQPQINALVASTKKLKKEVPHILFGLLALPLLEWGFRGDGSLI
ncbi:hypothetical protein BBJ28_00015618 [Nothophytophthora sp. Chile5]|nr:hypothetical protein BBJ28_00015618 [Nothophytophthora sp. Chile5]